MYDWVYIATPSGATLGRTIKLANGSIFDVGLIRRRVADDIPYLSEVAPGHKMLLTYDLFHTGVVYPIGLFTVIQPDHPANPYVRSYRKYQAMGEMINQWDLNRLNPAAYISDSNSETVMLGVFEDLSPDSL